MSWKVDFQLEVDPEEDQAEDWIEEVEQEFRYQIVLGYHTEVYRRRNLPRVHTEVSQQENVLPETHRVTWT